MSTNINVKFFCVLYSAERVVSDMAEDKACCASHLATQLPDHQLVACLRAAPGLTHQACLTLCSLVSCVEVTSIPAGSR